VVRSLSDVTDLPARRWELPALPVLKWAENPLGFRSNRRIMDGDASDDRDDQLDS
jgi:hypothetical protein